VKTGRLRLTASGWNTKSICATNEASARGRSIIAGDWLTVFLPRYPRHGRGPRIHDLRHTFAVRTLVNSYRTGMDTDREMVKLSTYLGHTKPSHTYWYIEAVPELLELASQRVTHALAREAVS
jgi:integrase